VGRARGGVDCSPSDEGHLFIASLTVAKLRRTNVSPNEQGLFDTPMLPLTQSG
jgi:hypothetical protein